MDDLFGMIAWILGTPVRGVLRRDINAPFVKRHAAQPRVFVF
jgi:hypothetical protein